MPNKIFAQKIRPYLKVLVTLPVLLFTVGAMVTAGEMLRQLQLDHAALQAAEQDYRSLRANDGLAGNQAADYAAYIARLQRRVFEDCHRLLRSGATLPDDLPCPVIVPPIPQAADIETESEQTLEEQIAAMDAQLNEGLGEFDEELLQEQERIKAAAPNTNSDTGGGAAGGSGTGNGAEGANGDIAESATGNEEDSDQQDTRSESTSTRTNTGPGQDEPGSDNDVPADIPDGQDDDVVARQLREAAEKETDPELKAKLWEEYRKYKQGTL